MSLFVKREHGGNGKQNSQALASGLFPRQVSFQTERIPVSMNRSESENQRLKGS